ncbi:MAG TPA: hypothetical protein PK093_16805 [Phycisphaerae bacterium]|nr:hypothetical protein [Phycisphaerae bacterium]
MLSPWFRRLLAYVWAGPNTMLGLCFWPLARAGGGHARLVDGVVEIEGGAVTWLLRNATPIGGAAALTLGHVILGQDTTSLVMSRSHEHVHVRQYKRSGPFFLPAYVAGSALAALCGEHFYRDNPFEREACEADKSAPNRRRNEGANQACAIHAKSMTDRMAAAPRRITMDRSGAGRAADGPVSGRFPAGFPHSATARRLNCYRRIGAPPWISTRKPSNTIHCQDPGRSNSA